MWISYNNKLNSVNQFGAANGVTWMERLGDIIKSYRKENKISARKFAEQAGFSHSYLSCIETGHRQGSSKEIAPSFDILRRVAVVMNMDLPVLMQRLGIDFDPPTQPDDADQPSPSSSTLSSTLSPSSIEPWEYIPLTQENLNLAVAEGRLMITPFRVPKLGMRVYIPSTEYDMVIAYKVAEVKGGAYTAKHELGTIHFSLFDIDRRVFVDRGKARLMLEAMKERAAQDEKQHSDKKSIRNTNSEPYLKRNSAAAQTGERNIST